jgi:hypothetical protein
MRLNPWLVELLLCIPLLDGDTQVMCKSRFILSFSLSSFVTRSVEDDGGWRSQGTNPSGSRLRTPYRPV